MTGTDLTTTQLRNIASDLLHCLEDLAADYQYGTPVLEAAYAAADTARANLGMPPRSTDKVEELYLDDEEVAAQAMNEGVTYDQALDEVMPDAEETMGAFLGHVDDPTDFAS
jgi:hypothetical protein